MWFNNALMFQYKLDGGCDLNRSLTEEALKPCPPMLALLMAGFLRLSRKWCMK